MRFKLVFRDSGHVVLEGYAPSETVIKTVCRGYVTAVNKVKKAEGGMRLPKKAFRLDLYKK